jgi:hypothetical protein
MNVFGNIGPSSRNHGWGGMPLLELFWLFFMEKAPDSV